MNVSTISYLTVVLIFCLNLSLAQIPPNDNCAFSTVLIVPEDGDTCFAGTTLNATSDGIYNSCDSLTQLPIPPGGHEVWYTYIATGTDNSITINPSGASPGQVVSVTIPNGNCSNSAYLVCDKAATLNGQAFVNQILAAGTQVWFSVSALTADGDFTVCIQSVTPPSVPAPGIGTDCASAIPICDKHTFTSPGPVFNNATGPISCYAFGPQNVLWYKFTAGTSDSLIWMATPNPGYELDWSINDITLGCPGIPVACNFATAPGGGAPTGMQSGSVNPCGPISQICTPIVLVAGNTYALHFNIENFLNAGIDTPAVKIVWGGNFKMAPYADFSLSANAGCDSITTSFVNNSSGASVYQWDFGNGNTSSSPNPPSQTYAVPGNYVVSLIASNPLSCAYVTSRSITVYPKPLSDFVVTDTIVCLGSNDSIDYAFASNPNYSYNWNFAGATIVSGAAGSSGPYVVNWNSSGTKNIQLSVIDNLTGCSSLIFTRNVLVITVPDSTFSLPAIVCEGQPIAVTYTGVQVPGSVYNWNFGSATVVSGTGAGPYSISFLNPGVYTVTLNVNLNGCFSDATDSITVAANPVSNAGSDHTVCSGEAVQLGQPGSLVYSYSWNPGLALSDSTIADPLFAFINASTQNDTLLYFLTTNAGSCSDTDTVQLIVQPFIASVFTASADTLCGNEVLQVNYTGNAQAPAVFNWYFAGGNAVNTGGQSYNITWSISGMDSVSLFVTQNGCSSDTSYAPIVIGSQPVAIAGPDIQFCSGQSDTLGVQAVAGVTYVWNPTNGLSGTTLSNPVLTLTNVTVNNDTIQYILNATEGFCSAYDTMQVIVFPEQQVSISGPVSICINNSGVQFMNTSQQVSGSVFSWNFGPNANPSTANSYMPPPVTFSATGLQTIYLIASSNACPPETDSLQLSVYPVPDPGFTLNVSEGCPPLAIQFTDTTTAQAGSTYFWDFGNGDTSSSQNPTALFINPGTYDVTLTVITPDTCSSSITLQGSVKVYDLPVPSFTATPPVANILNPLIAFENNSQNTDSCFYLFGDGFSSQLCTDMHLYSDTGTYLVQLITTNKEGCKDTAFQTVRVENFESLYIPNAFTPNNDIRNDVLLFQGSPLQDFHIEIYNRWGQLTFISDNQELGWDGMDIKSGRLAPEGIYAFSITYKDQDGKKHFKKGKITLIR